MKNSNVFSWGEASFELCSERPLGLMPSINDKTLDTLRAKYLKALISYEGVQRVENYPVPEETLREAILNAVAHKDYSSGSPIQISVYADKLLNWNSGHLPHDWTVDRLTKKTLLPTLQPGHCKRVLSRGSH
jgi:predicted HTH transcriptional regulator